MWESKSIVIRAIQIWVRTALRLVPKNVLIFRCCLLSIAATLCFADIAPVGSHVAGSLVTACFDKSFPQGDGLFVKSGPVVLQATDVKANILEARWRVLTRGQDKEPGVIDHLVQVCLSGEQTPTDELITACNQPIIEVSEMFQMGTDYPGIPQGMGTINQVIP